MKIVINIPDEWSNLDKLAFCKRLTLKGVTILQCLDSDASKIEEGAARLNKLSQRNKKRACL
jgi:hypothetical protein